MDYRREAPDIIKQFLTYHETICGHSKKTVDEYFLDLRTFFRFLKQSRGLADKSAVLDDIDISDVDLTMVSSVTLTDIYEYLAFLARDRIKNHNSPDSGKGLEASSRARKIAAIRSFYKYLTNKVHMLEENPVADLDSPRIPKTLPHYLSLDESRALLNAVDGKNKERDFAILMVFLSCGVRISELVGLDVTDIGNNYEYIRVTGKGNKERILYLNDACADALKDYVSVRAGTVPASMKALFVSRLHKRMSTDAVHNLVKKYIAAAGLDSTKYSAHKLRHTAATLMLQNGVDVRTLQEVLGHEHLNTTQIYTHTDNSEMRLAARANPLSSFKKAPPAGADGAGGDSQKEK